MDYVNINEQLLNANKLMSENDVKGTLACFGSSRLSEDTKEFKRAESICKALSKAFPEYHICGGGGPGLMEAFNKGATNTSIGMGITLPFESDMNEHVDIDIMFEHFFIRKYWLLHSAVCALAFEGGIGTMDELFETLTLIQTGKIKRIPIVLVGVDFWNRLMPFFKHMLELGTISQSDFDLFIISDDINTIIKYLKENIHEHEIN
jgi:uncharacterized protein (TIGR00730 family)